MMNAVACAYAEKTPLIVISGGPSISAREKEVFMWHTVKNCTSQLNAYSEVTEKAVILDNPKTAKSKIAEALTICQEYMLPVYIELPTDIVDQKIILTDEKVVSPLLKNQNNLLKATAEITKRINSAQKPCIMVGVESERFQLKDQIIQFAKKLNLPVVSTLLARDLIPTDEPNFFGTYLGYAGNPAAKKIVEECDLLLILGEMLSDVNLGSKLAALKGSSIICCYSREVNVADQVYENVPLKDLVKELSKSAVEKKTLDFPQKAPMQINRVCKDQPAPLVMSEVIDAVNWFFSRYGWMPVIADTGDCLFASLKIETSTVMASSFYLTMGFAVPAAIGYALTTKERPFVLVGDGAFQMTGQEISHCPQYGINPIFVVINNKRWGTEQLFDTSARFNELVNWPYAEFARLWGGKGYLCDNCEKLYRALEDAKEQKGFTLIEVVTNRGELSEELLAWSKEHRS